MKTLRYIGFVLDLICKRVYIKILVRGWGMCVFPLSMNSKNYLPIVYRKHPLPYTDMEVYRLIRVRCYSYFEIL